MGARESTQLPKALVATESEGIATFRNYISYISVSVRCLIFDLMAIMRMAIAGSGGLAQHFAHFINQTPHLFIILSRAVGQSHTLGRTGKRTNGRFEQPKPNLETLGYQVVVVDYDNQTDLLYALRGTDL